ncbi:MAG: hypothetical protein ABI693_32755 [Bryobacteraceae bacterium]
MPGLLLHVNAVVQCTHGAPATISPTQPRVLVSGQPVANITAPTAVMGCPFQIPVGPGTKPQPCVIVKWLMPSVRVLVVGQPAALTPAPGTAPGICQSVEQIPQGPPTVGTVQMRVIAS